MQHRLFHWFLFGVLCLIWGSSFILMKEGLKALNAFEVAAVRMLSAGVVLLPFAFKGIGRLKWVQGRYILLSGVLGSFIPAILFCVAEIYISSALAGMLNALTPLCVVLIGVLFFGLKTTTAKITGVLVGFGGMLILFFAKGNQIEVQQLGYSALVLLATLCYGLNVNLINKHLKETGSVQIAAIAFVALIPAALAVLWQSGFFAVSLADATVQRAIGASVLLGVAGTAFASILFYMLMKRAGPLFSSMVTYGIPLVAVGWGLAAGESVAPAEVAGLLVILGGVYLANK